MEYLVAIVAIVIGFGLPLGAVMTYIVLNYRQRRTLMELHHAQRMAAIERGLELPPLSMDMFERARSRRRSTSLLPALVWFFVGVAILIGMQSITDEAALIGLVPAGIGVAYFIYYFAEGRKIEARVLEQELGKAAGEAKAT
jgi:Domain of unknown function (DUF6249)